MTVHETDERRVKELLMPLQDIPPVPFREHRVPARAAWVRPALIGTVCLAAIVAVGAVILSSGGSSTSQPAGTTTPAPAPTTAPTPTGAVPPVTTTTATVSASQDLGVWFLKDGKAVRVSTPDTGSGPGAEQRALEALLAGPPAGYTSKVKAGTKLESFQVADTIATIKLSGKAPTGVALQQIVNTVTGSGVVHWVRLGDQPGLVNQAIAAGEGDVAAAPVELLRAESANDGTTIQFFGTADTFEAALQIDVIQDGQSLATKTITATCGSGCRGTFSGVIYPPNGFGGWHADPDSGLIVGASGKPTLLRAYFRSAQDGSIQDAVDLEIKATG
jgi:hypothetical protein